MQMVKISFLILIAMFFNTLPSQANKALPNFSQYELELKNLWKGTPAPVNLSSYKGAKTYRTKLREGAKAGPNFAGYYTVVTYGCGTQCQDNWVLDARTGKIVERFHSVIAPKYELKSRLLIINGPDADYIKAFDYHPDQPILDRLETIYKVMEGGRLKVIYKAKWADIIKSF